MSAFEASILQNVSIVPSERLPLSACAARPFFLQGVQALHALHCLAAEQVGFFRRSATWAAMTSVASQVYILKSVGHIVQLAAAELSGQLQTFADRTQLGLHCASFTLDCRTFKLLCTSGLAATCTGVACLTAQRIFETLIVSTVGLKFAGPTAPEACPSTYDLLLLLILLYYL